jgi:hypothetical protein
VHMSCNLIELYGMLQVTMAIAREVASVTRLGVEVCHHYCFSFF